MSLSKSLKNDHQFAADRISQLPDCLIGEILSQLPAIDAVKTGLLSHQWRHQWKSITALDFNFGETDINVELVTSTLLLHKNRSSISRFSVSCGHFINAEVDKWIQILTTDAQVKELTLLFRQRDSSYYELNKILYTAAFLTKLDISGCVVYPRDCSIQWDSLRSLSIGRITYFAINCYRIIDDETMKKILEGSPVLETLKFDGFCYYGTLHLSHENLKELEFQWFWGEGKIEITAPSLQSLTLESEFAMGGIRVVKAASNCRFRLNLPANEGAVMDVRHAGHVAVGPWLLKALSGDWPVRPTAPTLLFEHCKLLTLESSIDDWVWHLPSMEKALRSSPFLEVLFINLRGSPSLYDDDDDIDESYNDRCEAFLSDENDYWRRNMKPAMLHISKIRITVEGVISEAVNFLRLVRLFVNNAATLGRLIVNARGGDGPELFRIYEHEFKAFPGKLSPHHGVVQFLL